jgi:hypothetical protein
MMSIIHNTCSYQPLKNTKALAEKNRTRVGLALVNPQKKI